jgi:hypothetical protein
VNLEAWKNDLEAPRRSTRSYKSLIKGKVVATRIQLRVK